MNELILKTAPTVEPITLTEIKDYLRISDYESCSGLSSSESIISEERSPGVTTGSTVDTVGYIATVQIVVGNMETGALLDCVIEHSNNDVDWETYYTFDQISVENDTYLIKYSGDKRYIRVVATLTVDNSTFGVNVLLDQGYTTEDTYLQSLIKTARKYCEKHENRAYITQTWELHMNEFPSDNGVIELPFGSLQSVDSITYKDSDGNTTTLTENTDYIVNTNAICGKIAPVYGGSYPSFTPYPLLPVIITFTCGYGDSASDIPERVKLAMKLLIQHWYDNRIIVSKLLSNMKEVEFTFTSILDERILTL